MIESFIAYYPRHLFLSNGDDLTTATVIGAGSGMLGGAAGGAIGLSSRVASNPFALALTSGGAGGFAEGGFRAAVAGEGVAGIARAAVTDGLLGMATAGVLNRTFVGIGSVSGIARNAITRTNVAPKAGVSELYVHTWQGAWRGNVAGAGMGGRIWATPYSASDLASMSRLQRIWHIGRAKLPTDSVRVTGDALDEFVRVRGIGPFRLGWKQAGGQYFSRGPGSIDLTTGARTADFGARLRYAAMSTGSYTMDGLLVGSIGGSIYAYANGGWGTVFDAFLGNPDPVGN